MIRCQKKKGTGKSRLRRCRAAVRVARRRRNGRRADDRVVSIARLFSLSLAAVVLVLAPAESVDAQHRFSKTYPVPRNERLIIRNFSGSIRVEAGRRNEIKIVADLETSGTRLLPEQNDDGLVINVIRDNGNRADVGTINFRVVLPANLTVDVETKRGDIIVRDVSGQMVRAKVTLDGDIELTGLRVATVMAENMTGNILFDGELISGGTYKLESTRGDINVRIPSDSNFWLTAFAPTTRSINLDGFDGRLDHSDGRRITGNVGQGGRSSSLTVMNLRGPIFFKRR